MYCYKIATCIILVISILSQSCYGDSAMNMMDNSADMWGTETLRLIKLHLSTLSPPTVARTLSIVSTCMYDASVPYNPFGTSWSGLDIPKRPSQEINDANLNIAVSYAAYRALLHLFQDFPSDLVATKAIMTGMGLDPNDASELLFTPQGIGNKACKKVLALTDNDGWNFNGNEPGTKTVGVRYADYTNYVSKNDPQTTTGITDCSKLRDINSWQALKVPTSTNGTTIQKWAAPMAFNARMFASMRLADIDLQGPAFLNTSSNQDALTQNALVLNISSTLNDRQKVIAEFWADGPGTTNPPGHWYNIAITLATQNGMNLRRTINLLFAISNALNDAGIMTWTAKRAYDSVRPITSVQCLNANMQVMAWKGPYRGTGMINGSIWQPYQAATVVSPGFAEWPSGHSAFSSSSAQILTNFFGDDNDFGYAVSVAKGMAQFEPKIKPGHPGYIAGITDVPNSGPNTTGYSPANDVTLYYETYQDAAFCAAESRLYGGIHFPRGRDDGARIGRAVGEKVWTKVEKLIGLAKSDLVY
jgi:hypothetical protein